MLLRTRPGQWVHRIPVSASVPGWLATWILMMESDDWRKRPGGCDLNPAVLVRMSMLSALSRTEGTWR